jgi:hypothetical protein
MGPRAAIEAIRAAGGLPVLAHFADADRRRGLVAELREIGLGGLEVHYRHFSAATIESLAGVARDLALLPTGGTDYHGDLETYAEAYAELYVPDGIAELLHAALNRTASLR